MKLAEANRVLKSLHRIFSSVVLNERLESSLPILIATKKKKNEVEVKHCPKEDACRAQCRVCIREKF